MWAPRSDTLFSDDATALIHTTARGYPRAAWSLRSLRLSVVRIAVMLTAGDGHHIAGRATRSVRAGNNRQREGWWPLTPKPATRT
jgi:hypothetical protein